MKALLSIDYTCDFVAPDGALTTGAAGQAIAPALVALTRRFTDAGDLVVYAIDKHDAQDRWHPEQRLFPPHNLVGSRGRQLYGALQTLYEETKRQENVLWLDKRRYSAFCGTDLHQRLMERDIREVHLSGVCTDICVLHTAVDAYNLGYRIVVHQAAVASFDADGHRWALRHFAQALGAKVE